jgi:hypothetical protein
MVLDRDPNLYNKCLNLRKGFRRYTARLENVVPF